MKKTATLIALSLAFVLAGCNTVKGVGQDVIPTPSSPSSFSSRSRRPALA